MSKFKIELKSGFGLIALLALASIALTAIGQTKKKRKYIK